jgi:Uma2 family endonuclease
MTIQEFWAFCNQPENADRRLELLRGEVVEQPIPYHKHGAVCALVGAQIEAYARRVRHGYVVGANAGIILPRESHSVLGPDVAYFHTATLDGEFQTGWNESRPVLVVEVRSPNEDFGLLTIKIEEYVRNGVPSVWLIDYDMKCVTVHKPGREPVVFGEESELAEDGPLEGLSVPVTDLFRLPAERTRPLWSPPA